MPPAQRSKLRMNWLDCHKESFQIVNLWNGMTCLFHECLEVFLGALLAMKADSVILRIIALNAEHGKPIISFRFFDPRPRRLFHKGPFHSS
jgi:hypothetical protein